MAQYGTYQGIERAVGNVSRSFSGVMELKQRQQERAAEEAYRNKTFKQNVTEKNREFGLQESAEERAQRQFSLTNQVAEQELASNAIKLKEAEYQEKLLAEKRERDLQPVPLSQNPFLNYIKSVSPKVADMVQSDMSNQGYIAQGTGGFNYNQKGMEEYMQRFGTSEGKERLYSFLETARQDLENQFTESSQALAAMKPDDKNRQAAEQKIAQIQQALLSITAKGEALQTDMYKARQEQEYKKELRQIDITGEITKASIPGKGESAEKERIMLSYLTQARTVALKKMFANQPQILAKLSQARDFGMLQESMDNFEADMTAAQRTQYDKEVKEFIRNNAGKEYVSEFESRWSRPVSDEKQRALEILRQRMKNSRGTELDFIIEEE